MQPKNIPNTFMTSSNAQTHWNVIVCGGGLSGVCAAAAAARNGAKTLLLERDGSLGGTMTNQLVGPMMTFHAADRQVIGGLAQELVDQLVALGASPGHILDTSDYCPTITPFDAETLKLVAMRMVSGAGAAILYNTWITGVIKDGPAVRGVEVVNKGGRAVLTADVIIDCTGDGDVAALSGAPFEVGRAGDELVQPVSLMFKLANVDNAALRAYTAAHPEEACLSPQQAEAYLRQPLNKNTGFREKLRAYIRAGKIPIEREDILFFNTAYEDEVIVNTSRVAQVSPLDPWAMSAAENLAREQVFALFDFFRKEIPGFAHARLVAVGSRLGVRESRRIVGDYTLTAEDIMSERRFADAIACSAYPVDIHSLRPGEDENAADPYHGQVYEVPYRCLLPRGVEQLLVAGRCISATHEAQGSIRVSPNCMAFGQAAGTAALLSLREECSPRQLDAGLLRRVLARQGVIFADDRSGKAAH